VLYNLVNHPSLNDRELSEKIGMKISTLTSIKNRLRKGDYYRTLRIPNMAYLGYEILWVRYGRYNPTKDTEEIFQREKEIIPRLGLNTFYAIQDGHSFFSISVSKNFTEAQEQIRAIERNFQDGGYIQEFNYNFLPFDLTINLFDFDYSLLMKNTFDIEDDWFFSLPGIVDARGSLSDLRKNDVMILNSLIKNPELPDTVIANDINTTRQAVSRLRKRFEVEGILRTVRVPNIKALGYEVLIFSHQNHSPNLVNADLLNTLEKDVIDTIPMVYINSTDLESFGISVFSDFYQFQRLKEKIVPAMLNAGYLTDVPEVVLFSIPNVKFIWDLDFSHIEI